MKSKMGRIFGVLACPLFALAVEAPGADGVVARSGAVSQEVVPKVQEASPPTDPVPAAVAKKKGGNEFIVAPIPSYNPSQGFGLKLVGQYIYRPEGESSAGKPSILAASVFVTEEKSYGALGAWVRHFHDDDWRVIVSPVGVHFNYDYYGTGDDVADDVSIPLSENVYAFFGQALRRVAPNLYAGASLGVNRTDIKVNGSLPPTIVLPANELKADAFSAALVAEYDSRDNQFYPTRGTYAIARWDFTFGDHDFNTVLLDWNSYHALVEGQSVLALQVMGRFANGDVPFYGLSQFGQMKDLRGYKTGKYRDRMMAAAQLEYRHRLSKRWGFVVFAGAGEVFPKVRDFFDVSVLASAGVGLRFRLGEKNPVNFSFDYAYGRDGGTSYLYVGESF